MKWIPITYHKADEDERESGCDFILDCPLPEEGEEVLICIRGSNRISVDTLVYDGEGYYFDNEGDIESVSAWMPLPEAYEEDRIMNNVMSKDVILNLYGRNGDCKEVHLEQGQEYELTIKATYYDSDDLVLSFVNELSDVIVSVDDIINIEEAN